MPRVSTDYRRSHKALVELYESIGELKNKEEMESLLDEIATCDDRIRKRNATLPAYRPSILPAGVLALSEMMTGPNVPGTGVLRMSLDPWTVTKDKFSDVPGSQARINLAKEQEVKLNVVDMIYTTLQWIRSIHFVRYLNMRLRGIRSNERPTDVANTMTDWRARGIPQQEIEVRQTLSVLESTLGTLTNAHGLKRVLMARLGREMETILSGFETDAERVQWVQDLLCRSTISTLLGYKATTSGRSKAKKFVHQCKLWYLLEKRYGAGFLFVLPSGHEEGTYIWKDSVFLSMRKNELAWSSYTIVLALEGYSKLIPKLYPFEMLVSYLLMGGHGEDYPRALAENGPWSLKWEHRRFQEGWLITEEAWTEAAMRSTKKAADTVKRQVEELIPGRQRRLGIRRESQMETESDISDLETESEEEDEDMEEQDPGTDHEMEEGDEDEEEEGEGEDQDNDDEMEDVLHPSTPAASMVPVPRETPPAAILPPEPFSVFNYMPGSSNQRATFVQRDPGSGQSTTPNRPRRRRRVVSTAWRSLNVGMSRARPARYSTNQ